jgi:hypothetical protein
MKCLRPMLVLSVFTWSCARPEHRDLAYYEAKISKADLRQSILNMQGKEAVGQLSFEPSLASLISLEQSEMRRSNFRITGSVLVCDYPSRGTVTEFSLGDRQFRTGEAYALFGQPQPTLYLPKSYTQEEFFKKFSRHPIKLSPIGGFLQSFSGVPSNVVLRNLQGTIRVNVHHDGLIEYIHLSIESGHITGISMSTGTELD